jgi:hypothetical protein
MARRSPPRKVTYFEPVLPRLALENVAATVSSRLGGLAAL